MMPEPVKSVPDVDLSACVLCMACVQLCPDVFRENPAGYIEIIDSVHYPESCVDEAAVVCPPRCIQWIETR